MRLIDADKLHPDRKTDKGLAISQSQIANAETIQPQKWIPCSERLPKYGKNVLTCDLGGFIEIQTIEYNVWDDYSYWENQKGDWTDFNEVIAWMPLPKLYEPQESEEEE